MTTQKDLQMNYMTWLPNTAGWSSLSEVKRKWLQERTSNIAGFRQMQRSGLIGECRELFLIKKGLEGEKMTMEAYLTAGYGKSYRTGMRHLGLYKKLLQVMSDDAIEAIAADTENVFQGSGGLEPTALIRVAKTLPPLKSKEPKAIEGYLLSLREGLKQERRNRHKIPKPDEEQSLLIFVSTAVRLLEDLKLDDTRSQKNFLKTGTGYVMQKRAISGTLEVEHLSIPDDFFPKRGYPVGRKRTKNAE